MLETTYQTMQCHIPENYILVLTVVKNHKSHKKK